jgi:hypothetical protein
MASTYHELVEFAKHQKQSYGRTVKCEIYMPDQGVLVITSMHDDFHDIKLSILTNKDDMTIVQVAGFMERIPYPMCTKSLEPLQLLVGLPVLQKGIVKEVRRRIPRDAGCVHISEMLESSFRSLFAGVSTYVGEKMYGQTKEKLSMEEVRQLGITNPLLSNTCHAYSSSSSNEAVFQAAMAKLGGNIPDL